MAVAHIPLDEDYGYSTIEAFHSKKCVLTTNDSGGVAEIVQNNENGIITYPDSKSLAEAMDTLYTDRKKTMHMGQNGLIRIHELNINWSSVMEKLLA